MAMSINSKHLHDVANPGYEKIEIFHVRSGGNEGITLEQLNPTSLTQTSHIVEVSLDGLAELIKALIDVQQYYRPGEVVNNPDQLSFDI